jgi:signal peptide peptidase SppA
VAFSLKPYLPKRFRRDETVIPVVRLQGPIIAQSGPFRPTLSIATVAPLLEKAFARKEAPVVAISVNSPGGSPVQSRLIHKRIRDLAAEKQKEVLVFVEDVAASGGYMIACAGDEIVVDPSSIVGSIGVVSGGFGFVEAIAKLGIERRVHTAGQNKAVLDPFRPEKPEDVAHLLDLQREVHATFIDLVKERRGARLSDEPNLFSGLFWAGARGVELGLADRIGDLRGTLRERYGEKAKPLMIQAGRGLFGRRQAAAGTSADFGAFDAARVGAGLAAGLVEAAEERLLWSRYGL